jgi:hypothetical protein
MESWTVVDGLLQRWIYGNVRLSGGAAPGGDDGGADADGSTAPRTTGHHRGARALRLDELDNGGLPRN